MAAKDVVHVGRVRDVPGKCQGRVRDVMHDASDLKLEVEGGGCGVQASRNAACVPLRGPAAAAAEGGISTTDEVWMTLALKQDKVISTSFKSTESPT